MTAALVLLCGCSLLPKSLRPFSAAPKGAYPYDVELVGVGGQLATRLKEASVLFTKNEEAPASLQGLRYRARTDRDLLLRVMRSRGYYEGDITWDIDTAAKPPLVSVKVTRGTRFTITRYTLEGLPEQGADLATAKGLASLGVVEGGPALSETVIASEQVLLTVLADRGFPFAEIAQREARIDRRARTMDVLVRVDAGPLTRFGEITLPVEGLETVDLSFLLGRLKFERGQVFTPAKLEESRKALFASNVFTAVSFSWGERGDVAPNGEVPIRVIVAEGDMHSIGAGVKYSSAEGVGGRVFWEDRNLTGRADRLRVEAQVTQLLSEGGVSYLRPDWLRLGQSLLLDARFDSDQPPAYERTAATISAGVERPLTPHLVATAGLAVEQSYVNGAADSGGTSEFTLLGLPLGLRYDASDSILDPTRGHRLLIGMTPYVSVYGESVQMLALRATESFYVPLREDGRQIWATRLSIGSVVGPSRSDLPADKRLYAGGGDSVRGYAFQFVGPLRNVQPLIDPGDPFVKQRPEFRPLGGRSLLQAGTELRWKVTKDIGLVPFVEGAGVYDAMYPDFSEDFQWAAGLGFRYFTVAGPIRLDLAFPLNPRQSDSIFQIYISLGQAF